MNNDLISRESLLNDFNDKCQRTCPNCEYHKWNAKLYRYECELINTAPTVEARPQGKTNADIFKQTFGLYATEVWSMSESQFLEWLNSGCDCKEADNEHIKPS